MAELKATVCLQGKDIEVISSHIEFNRKTDNKGRPVTNVIGTTDQPVTGLNPVAITKKTI